MIYWGIQREEDGRWLSREDGTILYYPCYEIAQAHLDKLKDNSHGFGKIQVSPFNEEI